MSFATARLAVSTADQEIDPAALPAAAQDFYAEPVELTGGVNFAGTLDLTGRLADAFGYAGYASGVDLEGTLAGSAAALFGRADARLGDLRLKTTLRKSPTAPAWIAERTSTYEFALEGGAPSLSIDEDLSVALDGATHHFNGNVTVAPAGAIEGRLAPRRHARASAGLRRSPTSISGSRANAATSPSTSTSTAARST